MITYEEYLPGLYKDDCRSGLTIEMIQDELDSGGAEVIAYTAPDPTLESLNPEKMRALQVIDSKSIRALREGDTIRINQLEVEAQEIRDSFVTP